MDLQVLVLEFAEYVAGHTDEIWNGDHKTANAHEGLSYRAFLHLCAVGDPGREALRALLSHQRPDVRAAAAAHLLRCCTDEARAVLQAVAAETKGYTHLIATEALKRWDEGTWALDPVDPGE